MRLAIIILAQLLAACTTLGPSTEQIKAMEGTSSSFCFKSPGWNGSAIEAHYSSFGGKSTGTAGGGGKATCGASTVEFTNEGRVVKP
jgi:hypothetical protein